MKRFYKDVSYETYGDKFAVLLDGKVAKTPLQKQLLLPNVSSTKVIVQEFSKQKDVIDVNTMPFLRIANTVVDGVMDDWQPLLEDCLRYISSDMLLYRADSPEELIQEEKRYWDPALLSVEEILGIVFELQTGLVPRQQTPQISDVINKYFLYKLKNFDEKYRPFIVAILHILTTLSGSVLLAIAIIEKKISFDDFIACAFLEENWSVRRWGEDKEALEKRTDRIKSMKAAFDFFMLLSS